MSKFPVDVSADHPEHGVIQNAINIENIKNDESLADESSTLILERSSCTTKAKIMDVAAERFAHYGYGKTTIADISTDCKMSSGNIYRYFESKLDIAAAITHDKGMQVTHELREKIAQKPKARDRLRVFMFSSLRTTFRQLEDMPRMVDMANSVRKHRPEVRRKIRKMERRLLGEILKYGRKTGEFRVDCTQSAARVIQCLVSRFRWPQLSAPQAKLARLETELEGTLAMIFSALGAGCLLGAIMRSHPKDKDENKDEGEQQDIAQITHENSHEANIKKSAQ